jgi:phosphohistidine phosphatase
VTARTLVILRHAKAADPEQTLDIDRPLAARGRADAAAAGTWLTEQGYAPDVVLCSPARRTRETWHRVALALTEAPEVRYEEALYGASALGLLELVTELPDEVETAVLVGHNPGLSQLSMLLDQDADGLSTAGIAVHSLDGAWAAFGPRSGRLVTHHTARAHDR